MTLGEVTGRPLFSVVIPTRDRPQFVREAVGSVLAQTVSDYEVIVVNDGGSAVTGLGNDPRIRIVELPVGRGPASARNEGLERAVGEYVAFLDDDDLWLPSRLELAVQGLRSAPVAGCLNGWLGDPDHRTAWSPRLLRQVDHPLHLGCVAVLRRIAPRFDPKYLACEDVDWWIRLSSSQRVTIVPAIGYLLRSHDGARGVHGRESRLRFSRQLLLDHEDYYRTHRRARAYRLKRIGLRELARGDRTAARQAFRESLRASPSARTAWHLIRAADPRSR